MFAIRPIFKMLLLAVPAAIGAVVVFNLLTMKQSIDWRTGLQRCVKRLPAILAVALVCSVLCMGYMWTGSPYQGSFKVGYTYPKASKGLTPSGTPLDVNEIFSDQVLALLLEKHPEWDVSAEELRDTLSIGYVRQRGDMSPDNLYVSTEYIVSYKATERTESLDKNELLQSLSEVYYDYFVETYGRKTNLLEDDYKELSDLDYLDMNRYLRNRASMLIKYMEMCSKENSSFVSETTGESFDSVKDKAQSFQNVSLERFESYILKYGVSMDRGQYISRLNFENRLEDVEYMKNLAAYSVRLAAIARYDGDITRAVLVPTRDATGEYYQSRTKIGTDYFASDANSYLSYATNNQLNIETDNYHIDCLSNASGGADHRQKTDEMAAALKTEIMQISNLAIETVKDYDAQTSNGYVSFTLHRGGTSLRPYLKQTVLYGAALACGIGAAIVTNHRPKGQKKRV